MTELSEVLSLVLTERPIEFETQIVQGIDSRVSYKAIGWNNHVYAYAVFVDLSAEATDEQQYKLVEAAKGLLAKLDEALLSKP